MYVEIMIPLDGFHAICYNKWNTMIPGLFARSRYQKSKTKTVIEWY